MSLPLNAGGRGGSRTEGKERREKTHDLVLPCLFGHCVSVPVAETLKTAKILSELCSAYHFYCTFYGN